MSTETVSHNIERLVDHLRENSDSQITLGDVASVTEVLLSIMRRYFNTIDISIYGELREMSQHISKAREEIAELRPKDLKEERIPRAGKELEAIVQATEAATGTIMDAAEEIMNVDGSDPDADQQVVMDACMRIFEACSFQDITGQRITKVVSTLTYIEDRLSSLQTIWGPDVADKEIDISEDDDEYEKAYLLKGPSLEGEGIDQNEVDAVLAAGGSDASPDAAAPVNGTASPSGEQHPECAEAEAGKIPPAGKSDSDDEPRANGKPAAKKSAANGAAAEIDDAMLVSGEEVSQADIDALFD